MARRYQALEYATDCVRADPADPLDAPPPEPTPSWGQRFRRLLLQQLMMAIISAVLLKLVLAPQLEAAAQAIVQDSASQQPAAQDSALIDDAARAPLQR